MEIKTVTIFGSSKPVPGEEEYESAYKLGKLLGKAGLNVCTGGYQGIMDAVSKGGVEEGVEAIGITVDIFNAIPNKHLTKEIECHTLFERIDKLVDSGDAYIVLPGGTGTLLELSIIWEYFNKELSNSKPAACLGKMWGQLVSIMDERMRFEERKVGLIKDFLTIDECAGFIIDSLSK